jgi:hypothetical protein
MNLRLLSAVLVACPLAAEFEASAWKFRRQLAAEPGLAAMRLDRAVYAAARTDLSDLRVIRGTGEETPYVLETLSESYEDREAVAEILDRSATSEGNIEVTLALPGATKHSVIRLGTERQNFRQQVRIEASDDRRRWFLLRADGYIFDFSPGDRRFRSLTIEYPLSTRRFLRVTVLGWRDPNAITGAWLRARQGRAAVRETFATVTPQRSEDSKTQSTSLMLDLGVAGLPVDRIHVETSSSEFHRGVEVETSTDAKSWNYVAGGVLYRVGQEESGAIAISESHSRYYRLRILNRDDKPLALGNVTFRGLVRQVKFQATPGGEYWLYYGNPTARVASYDLPLLLARREGQAARMVTASPEQANPSYRPPPEPQKPWSERHPALLYTVLAIAVISLGAATFRFFSKVRQA